MSAYLVSKVSADSFMFKPVSKSQCQHLNLDLYLEDVTDAQVVCQEMLYRSTVLFSSDY